MAQAFAPPGERMIELDGERVPRKMDVRLYTYGGQVLLAAVPLPGAADQLFEHRVVVSRLS